MTIQNAFSAPKNNFTALRVVCALSVIYYHAYPLSLGRGAHDPITLLGNKLFGLGLGGIAVGAFFVISGFLVAASYDRRNSAMEYFIARALRILPALIVVSAFCVFVVGPLVTTLPLREYFVDGTTWRHLFRNSVGAFGFMYKLPGVFEDNPWPNGVNGSLWSLRVEMIMYAWLLIIGLLGGFKSRLLYNMVYLICMLGFIKNPSGLILADVDGLALNPALFFTGVFFYINRNSIKLSVVSLFVLLLAFAIFKEDYKKVSGVILFAYAVLYLALSPALIALRNVSLPDISYGIYIYAFPVQQMTAHFYRGVTPVEMTLIATSITVVLAYFSWVFVERPAIRLKSRAGEPLSPKWKSKTNRVPMATGDDRG